MSHTQLWHECPVLQHCLGLFGDRSAGLSQTLLALLAAISTEQSLSMCPFAEGTAQQCALRAGLCNAVDSADFCHALWWQWPSCPLLVQAEQPRSALLALKIQDAQEGTKGSRNMAIMSKLSTSNTCNVTERLTACFQEACRRAQHGVTVLMERFHIDQAAHLH